MHLFHLPLSKLFFISTIIVTGISCQLLFSQSAHAFFLFGDSSAPTVSITSPTENTIVADTVTVTANASDNKGVKKVEFFVDEVVKFTDTASPFNFSWDTTNAGAHPCTGAHTHNLKAKAYDAAGNTKVSTVVIVKMNNPPHCTGSVTPMVTSIQPTLAGSGQTQLSINLFLHGIGKAGDSAAPGTQGNSNPAHPQREIAIDTYNSQNNLVLSKQGIVTFNQASGSFKGVIAVENTLPSGLYTLRIKADQYLRINMPGIQQITAGQINQIPQATLVTGDITNDNKIDILDYNILIDCYSDLLPANSCDAGSKQASDLTDEGDVNQFDYNLFLREVGNIGGQ